MGANSPYFEFSKVDDVGVVEAADFERIETGLANVDTDKADKVVPALTNNLAALGATGNLVDSGKAFPSGVIVGTTDTQTLTNKTLSACTNDDSNFTGSITEEVYTLSGTDIDPANGTIQVKTFTTNTTFTESLSAGEYVTLHLIDGDSYTVTWPTITWVGDTPSLTANHVVVVWKVSSTLYGREVGAAA